MAIKKPVAPEKEAEVKTKVPESSAPEAAAPEKNDSPEDKVIEGDPEADQPNEKSGDEPEFPESPQAPRESVESGSEMVKVRNKSKSFQYQPATGIYIQRDESREMKNDDWLKMQVRVGLLERV